MLNLSIILLYTIINIIFGLINLEKMLWINYLVILILPMDVLYKMDITYFPIIDVIFFISIVLVVVKKYIIDRDKMQISPVILILIIFLIFGYSTTLIISINEFGKLSLIDGYQYFKFILIFFISSTCFPKKSISKFIKVTLVGVSINSIILILIYIFNSTNLGIDRYSFGCESMYIFTIPVQLYMLYSKKYELKYKLFILISIIIQSILLILAQNRTNPIVIVCSILILMLFGLIYKRHDIEYIFKNFSKLIILSLVLTIILIDIGKNYNIINSDFISRFSEMTNGYNTTSTYGIRKMSNDYYNDLTKSKLSGYGFGTYMPHVVVEGIGYDKDNLESFQTDNLLVVHAYKTGIFNTIIFILIFVITYIKIFQFYIKYKKLEYVILIITLPFFYVGTGYMTSQIIHNNVITVFVWMLIGMINNNEENSIK